MPLTMVNTDSHWRVKWRGIGTHDAQARHQRAKRTVSAGWRAVAVANSPLHLSRRAVLRRGLVTASALGLGGSRAPAATVARGRPINETEHPYGPVTLLTTQLTPAVEARLFRESILEPYPGVVDVIPAEPETFAAVVAREIGGGVGSIGVIGALHGDFASLAADGFLSDLSDFANDRQDLGFLPEYLEIARFGGTALGYLPWMQATFVMVARRDALPYLPGGLTEETLSTALTYERLLAWAETIAEVAGPKFGLPAGPTGLLHRFLQGYLYPSFTGGINRTIRGSAAVLMWEWLRQLWSVTNPASIAYDAMADPLRSGDVWLAWDHTARLIPALRHDPAAYVAFPAPSGPRGRGFMPVIAGLGVPISAPDIVASRALISYLTRTEVQALTLREVAFFPTIDVDLPSNLDPGMESMVSAVLTMMASPDAVPSLLPVGLREWNVPYNQTFRDAFAAIVIDGNDIPDVLESVANDLQSLLTAAQAPCWLPDAASLGVCTVG